MSAGADPESVVLPQPCACKPLTPAERAVRRQRLARRLLASAVDVSDITIPFRLSIHDKPGDVATADVHAMFLNMVDQMNLDLRGDNTDRDTHPADSATVSFDFTSTGFNRISDNGAAISGVRAVDDSLGQTVLWDGYNMNTNDITTFINSGPPELQNATEVSPGVFKYEVWVIASFGLAPGLLGFAWLPAAGAASRPYFIVVNAWCMGSAASPAPASLGATPNPLPAAYRAGRTGTHEFGHMYDLLHVWDTRPSASPGDVDDLPCTCNPTFATSLGPSGAAAGEAVICGNEPCDPLTPYPFPGTRTYGAFFMNYMDYGTDNAVVAFSIDQCDVMGAAIDNGRSFLIYDTSTATVPSPPTAVTATHSPASAFTAVVSWTAPASNGGSPLTSYTVTATTGGETTATANASTTTANVVIGVGNLPTAFTVVATNAVGDSDPSAPSASYDGRVPDPPTNLALTSTGVGELTATLTNPTWIGGNVPVASAIMGYRFSYVSPPSPVLPSVDIAAPGPYTLTGLLTGTYQVTAQTLTAGPDGGSYVSASSAASNQVSISTGAPSVPLNLAATPGNAQVTLTYGEPADVGAGISNYEYRVDAGAWVAVGNQQSIVVGGLTNGTTYAFEVRAIGLGVPSEGPAAGPVNSMPLIVPSAPQNGGKDPVTVPGERTVTWSAPASAGTPLFDRYRVTVASGAIPAVTVTAPTTEAALSGLSSSQVYVAQVVAFSAAAEAVVGAAAYSPVLAIPDVTVLDCPVAPTNLVLVPTGAENANQFVLTWEQQQIGVIDNYSLTLSGFSAVGPFTVPAGTTSYVVSSASITPFQDYAATLCAVNAVSSDASCAPCGTSNTAQAGAPPAAPTDVCVVPGFNSLELSWAIAGSTGPLLETQVFLNDALIRTLPPDATRTIIVGLPPGTSGTMAVRSTNAAGAGALGTSGEFSLGPFLRYTLAVEWTMTPTDVDVAALVAVAASFAGRVVARYWCNTADSNVYDVAYRYADSTDDNLIQTTLRQLRAAFDAGSVTTQAVDAGLPLSSAVGSAFTGDGVDIVQNCSCITARGSNSFNRLGFAAGRVAQCCPKKGGLVPGPKRRGPCRR